MNEIDGFNYETDFGRSRFSIKLDNGKRRDLTAIKSQAEFNELKKLIH